MQVRVLRRHRVRLEVAETGEQHRRGAADQDVGVAARRRTGGQGVGDVDVGDAEVEQRVDQVVPGRQVEVVGDRDPLEGVDPPGQLGPLAQQVEGERPARPPSRAGVPSREGVVEVGEVVGGGLPAPGGHVRAHLLGTGWRRR